MLSQQLRQLERDRIITRIVHAEVPPKVEYHLTDWGQALIVNRTWCLRVVATEPAESCADSRRSATVPTTFLAFLPRWAVAQSSLLLPRLEVACQSNSPPDPSVPRAALQKSARSRKKSPRTRRGDVRLAERPSKR
jgi:hypothetical protein